MNAREQEKANEATQRHLEDEQDRLVEAIGALLARRASRKAQLKDRLLDIRIEQSDVEDLGDIAEELAFDNEDPPRIAAAYRAVAHSRDLDIDTVADLADAIVKKLAEIPAREATS